MTGKPLALSVMAGLLISALSFVGPLAQTSDTTPISVAFLGVQLQNDNEGLEPTTDAERARMGAIEQQFKSKLEGSGRYKFVTVPDEVKAQIASGQDIGACNGCEVEFGRKLGAKEIAWLKVQKVSNLILNMNAFMADVAAAKMTFLHSVDIRGNTDESWIRSLNYLIDNYLLSGPSGQTRSE